MRVVSQKSENYINIPFDNTSFIIRGESGKYEIDAYVSGSPIMFIMGEYSKEEYATFVLSSISSINGFKENSDKIVVFIPSEETIKEFIDKVKEAVFDINELATMTLLLFTKNYWMEGKYNV